MSIVYVNENGTQVTYENNRCIIKSKDGGMHSIPIETVEGITLLTGAQMTTKFSVECLKRGIMVSYLSRGGRYFGRLVSTGHINAERQRRQCKLYHTDFAIKLAQKIIMAKLHNQSVILRRYAKSKGVNVEEEQKLIHIMEGKISQTDQIHELMGYEGQGAKMYFNGLSKCIEPEFQFKGRSRRPPRDEFNSLISLGYSILMNEFYAKIEMKGLNAYFGFLHQDSENHPTLASDLMEEWRAVISDTTALSMINGHEIHKDHFEYSPEDGGCYLTYDGLKLYLNKLEKKMQTSMKYLNYYDHAISFRTAIGMQVDSLVRAIESEDTDEYEPIRIR